MLDQGVDLDTAGPGYGAINRIAAQTTSDADSYVSSQPGGDEWAPNVTGETPYATADFQSQQPPPVPFTHPGAHCPRLHGVMISLVAKSRDPDPTYRSPGAFGIVTMNTPVTVAPPYPDTAHYLVGKPKYRRRVQTLKINLRNYAYEG